MKKPLAILFVLIFAALTKAQAPSPTAADDAAKSIDNKTVENASKTASASQIPGAAVTRDAAGKIVLPPEKASPVRAAKFAVPPVIDGKLDDEAWKSAQILKDFIQTSPGDNIAASKRTEAYVGYDEKNLYIAFKCWDEPDKIRATVAKRDEVFGEDNVRVWLDTYNDRRRAYVLGWNPYGIQQDGIFTEGQGPDFSVDIVMESRGVIEDWGWSVEVKIPFKSLRYSAGKGKLWGFNAAREIDRLNREFDSWMPDDKNISGFLIKHGKLTGLDEVKTERTLEIAPSVTVGQTGRRFSTIPQSNLTGNSIDPGRFVNQPIKQDIGVNFKFNVTPNITFDAAYNPDFAEIEADAPVVSANQRFPIFFQEKRPFFLEGVEIFQTPLRIFYTRNIIDPDIAAKLTGKVGKYSFGFLGASDNAPGNYSEEERNDRLTRPRIDEFLDKNATFGVARVKRDFGKENNVGFMATYRGFPEQRNVLTSFDARFKLNPKLVLQLQAAGTTSRRCFLERDFEPTIEPFQARRNREICGGGSYNGVTVSGSPFSQYRTGNGFGYLLNLDYTEKNRGFVVQAFGRTRDYRADAGFTRRTNTNEFLLGARFSTEANPKARIIRFDFRPFVKVNYDWQGRAQDEAVGASFGFSLQRNTRVGVETGWAYERVLEEEFGLKRSATRTYGAFFGASERSTKQQYASVDFETSPSKKFSLGLSGGYVRNALDFDFGNGAGNGFETRFPRISPAALSGLPYLDPGAGRQFDIGASIEYKPTDPFRVSLEYNKSRLTRSDTELTAFDSNIFTLRSTYQFTRFTFARVRWDYDSLNSNASGQMLLGWNPNPGTAFYVGYNDNFNYNGFSPYTGQLEPRFERNSRTFFIRASYLFRKSF